MLRHLRTPQNRCLPSYSNVPEHLRISQKQMILVLIPGLQHLIMPQKRTLPALVQHQLLSSGRASMSDWIAAASENASNTNASNFVSQIWGSWEGRLGDRKCLNFCLPNLVFLKGPSETANYSKFVSSTSDSSAAASEDASDAAVPALTRTLQHLRMPQQQMPPALTEPQHLRTARNQRVHL